MQEVGTGPKCATIGCRRIATKHCRVTLGTIPLEYDFCVNHSLSVERKLYNAGYKPVITELSYDKKEATGIER